MNSTSFFKGVITGAIGALLISGIIYGTHLSIDSIKLFPIHQFVINAYDFIYQNLKLSIVPFTIIIIWYFYLLTKLNKSLANNHHSIEYIAQTEHLIDTCISLFFGIGVIWTAIGMRSALIFALGDPENAAANGAFAILQRMVDGGILLALSTTIFGGIGGYLMRMVKSLFLGQRIQSYYNQHLQKQSVNAYETLLNIDNNLNQILLRDKS